MCDSTHAATTTVPVLTTPNLEKQSEVKTKKIRSSRKEPYVSPRRGTWFVVLQTERRGCKGSASLPRPISASFMYTGNQ